MLHTGSHAYIRKSWKKQEQLSKTPSSGHCIFVMCHWQMLELVLFESPQLWLSIALFLMFIQQHVDECKCLTSVKNMFVQICSFAQSQNHVFL
jgi:hypothetical protein